MQRNDKVLMSAAVAHFLAHEADLIDRKLWSDWIELFDPQAVLWMPHRDMNGAIPDSPQDSINLFYIESRAVLENRIQRSAGGDSVANTPMPLTSHLIGSVLAARVEDDLVHASANFVVSASNPARGVQQRWGRYEYILRAEGEDFRILQKKIIALDEVFDGFLDIYLV